MLKKSEKVLISLIFISFMAYTISTFVGNDFFIELMSPVTVGFVLALLISEIGRLGQFKWSTVAMIVGISLWFLADILYFLGDFVLEDADNLIGIANDIYLFPDAFFALCITIYMVSKLIKSRMEIAFLMSNTLCFAITLFVIILRFHIYAAGENSGATHWKELIFFFVSFYIIMMCFELFIHLGLKGFLKGTAWTAIGVLIYAVLDIQYDFMRSIGLDAENDIINLLYIFSIVIMGVGTTYQIAKNYQFDFIPRDFSKAATTRRFLFIVVVIICDIIMIEMNLLTQHLGMYILITLLSYLITNYVLHSMHLSEELLRNQREQNVVLEERIQEKTKDLAEANDQLQVISSTDMLTGLLNRRSAIEFMEEITEEYNEYGKSYAVFCIDLNHFKPVNDTYGHEMGDRVLAEMGARLRKLPREYHAFRVGGDEFMVCLTDVDNHNEVEKAAERLKSLFNTPVIYDTYIFNLSASIGIALLPDDGNDYETLLNYADSAMYDIKKSGNKDNYKFFDSGMIKQIAWKEQIADAVAASHPDKDYVLYYQPQVDMANNKLLGVEVFPHLCGGLEGVSPAELIPIAEECGVMSGLGIWTARKSVETISEWNSRYGCDISITINLSPLQLLDAEFVEAIEKMSDEHAFSKGKLILDISSDVIMGADSSSRDTMEAFHNCGFKLSLNDFGGNSINLHYLMSCGINFIKLSRNLVSEIETDESIKILVESIISFASKMGITVTAVGVETESQSELLKSMGITKMQGYLFGKPVREDEFEKMLDKSAIEWK